MRVKSFILLQSNSLVDQKLWAFVQEQFPSHVESRLAGEDDVDVNEVFPCLPVHKFAEGGDIKTEFEEQLNKAREEDRRKRHEEDALGASLAEEMEREEQRLLREAQEQESLGLQFARKMWKDMTQSPAPGTKKRNRSVLDMLKSSPSPSSSSNASASQSSTASNSQSSTSSVASTSQSIFSSPPLISQPSTSKLSSESDSFSSSSPQHHPVCNDKEDPDSDTEYFSELFSPDIIEEQIRIEKRMIQEKKDKELAEALQSESIPDTNTFKTPKTSKISKEFKKTKLIKSGESQLSGENKSRRQLSIFDCSPQSVSSSISEEPDKENTPSCSYSTSRENVIDQKVNFGIKQGENVPDDWLNLTTKVETDIQRNIFSIRQPSSEDEIMARKLQRELNAELSSSSCPTSAASQVKLQSSSRVCRRRHKSVACSRCAGCLHDNCGKCVFCRDMPRFGGKCVLKQKCVYRKCLQPVKKTCPQCS